MKNKIYLLLIVITTFIACDSTHQTGNVKSTGKDSLQTVAVYECPMKCEGKTYAKPGKCSVCGMELVEKK